MSDKNKTYRQEYYRTHRKQRLEYGREYYKNHIKRDREYQAKRGLTQIWSYDKNGKRICFKAPNKRQKPLTCELCGRFSKYLAYHHWYDSNPSVGIWLCYLCHMFAEGVDNDRLSKYLELRHEIESSFKELCPYGN